MTRNIFICLKNQCGKSQWNANSPPSYIYVMDNNCGFVADGSNVTWWISSPCCEYDQSSTDSRLFTNLQVYQFSFNIYTLIISKISCYNQLMSVLT